MKYCPTSPVVKNLSSVQILTTRFCCDSLSTRSWYLCTGFFQRKIIGRGCRVFHEPTCWHKQRVRLSRHKWSLRSNMANFVFFTHIKERSVDTELIDRNNCLKNTFYRVPIGRSASTIFHYLRSWAFLVTMDSWHGLLRNSVPFSLWFAFTSRHNFFDPSQKNDHRKSSRIYKNEFGAIRIPVHCFDIPIRCRWTFTWR